MRVRVRVRVCVCVCVCVCEGNEKVHTIHESEKHVMCTSAYCMHEQNSSTVIQ